MSYVLIIVWGLSVATAEFNSEAACEDAAGLLRLHDRMPDVHTICVRKGLPAPLPAFRERGA